MNDLLVIDPAWAKPYSCCYFRDAKLWDHFQLDYDELFKKIMAEEVYIEPTFELLIEEPYLGINPNTLTKLCYAVGGIILPASVCGIKWHFVKPVHWKRYWNLTGKNKMDKKTFCPDELQKSGDLMDAYLMGQYWINKHIEAIRGI
jgi:hypothetical protein